MKAKEDEVNDRQGWLSMMKLLQQLPSRAPPQRVFILMYMNSCVFSTENADKNSPIIRGCFVFKNNINE
jgi:hypothetical protein